MRIRSRIVAVILTFLLVPAFSQVLSARTLLRCADGRECSPPIPELKCKTALSCCHDRFAKLPVDPARRCVWMTVPGLDLRCPLARPLISAPELLLIENCELLSALIERESRSIGIAIERVPIVRMVDLLPGQGVGVRSPPSMMNLPDGWF